MSKTLTLKARAFDAQGNPTWHDVFIMNNALSEMVKGAGLAKSAVFLRIAGKIELAREQSGLGDRAADVDVSIDLRNSEARVFWRKIEKLAPEQYGRTLDGVLAVPRPGILGLMLEDIASQLGFSLPEPDEDEDDST